MRKLSPDRERALVSIYESNGFQAVLDVFENLTLEAEDELIGEPPGDATKILALHAVAHAHRAMLTKACNQIDVLVAESLQREKQDTLAHRKTVGLTGE